MDFGACQVGHIQRLGSRVPGVSTIRGVFHIGGGVDCLVLGIQYQHRAIWTLRHDDRGNGTCKLVIRSGLTNQNCLAGQVRNFQRVRGILPGLTAVCAVLGAAGRLDSLRPVIHRHIRRGTPLRNGDSNWLAGELILRAVVADIDGRAILCGYIQRLSCLRPVDSIRGNVHLRSGIDGLILGVQSNIRLFSIIVDVYFDRLTGEGTVRVVLTDEDGLPCHVRHIKDAIAGHLIPGQAIIGRVLRTSQVRNRGRLLVNDRSRLFAAQRDRDGLRQAGKVGVVELRTKGQGLSALVRYVIPSTHIGPSLILHDLSKGGVSDQGLILHVEAEPRQCITGRNNHSCGVTCRVGAVAAIPHQDGLPCHIGNGHVVQAGNPTLAVIVLHGRRGVHALSIVIDCEHRSGATYGHLNGARLAVEGVLCGRDADKQSLTLKVFHIHLLGAGLPGQAAILGILHVSSAVHVVVVGIYSDIRGSGPLGQDFDGDRAVVAGAIINESHIDGAAGYDGVAIFQLVRHGVVITATDHFLIEVDGLILVVDGVIEAGILDCLRIRRNRIGRLIVVGLGQALHHRVIRTLGESGELG